MKNYEVFFFFDWQNFESGYCVNDKKKIRGSTKVKKNHKISRSFKKQQS